MPLHVHARSAFTLLEVMMASSILVVGFIGLIQAATIGLAALDTARKQEVAMQLMNTEIARLRSSSWSRIAALAATGTISIQDSGTVTGDQTAFALTNFTTTASDDDTSLTGLAHGFTCTFARSRLRPTSATSTNVTYVRVVYTVSWTSNTGRTLTRSTEAFFAKNGLHLSYRQT